MRKGRNPTRRNRNIGTSKQGHGQNNRMAIPCRWKDSIYQWRRTPDHNVVRREVWGREMPFMVEHTLEDHFHACTVDDIAAMLRLLPREFIANHQDPDFPEDADLELKGIQGMILRQPTRKEQALFPIWGHIAWAIDVGPLTGPVITIPSQSVPTRVVWGKNIGPEDRKELDRLVEMADEAHVDGRHHTLVFQLEGVRRVQLYHTLPHEVGHWADLLVKVELPSLLDTASWESLWNRFLQRPASEREGYAHRFADAARARLGEQGLLPFARKVDRDTLRAEGLRPEDFIPD